MLLFILFLLFGLLLLVVATDRFIVGAAGLATRLRISPLIVGLVVVGMATSAPELLVSAMAALHDGTCIAIGNSVGSNIANIGMVLGISALLIPVTVCSATLRLEYALMLIAAVLSLLVLLDSAVDRLDALILLGALLLIISMLVRIGLHARDAGSWPSELDAETAQRDTLVRLVARTFLALVVLLCGAEMLVRGAIGIARHFGVSDLIIGLSIIAVGTSLPELAAAIVSLMKKEADIAIGNIIGSNMFNSLAVIGVPALIAPAGCPTALLGRDFPLMFGLSVFLGIILFCSSRGHFSRATGAMLVLVFVTYQYLLYLSVAGSPVS